jgi:transcriptional regulator with XRE-family HTH domain
MPFDEARGERLKGLVGSREIQEFSRQIDVSPGSLYGYFRGNPIGGIALAKLSEALGVSQEEIVNGPSGEAEADERSSQELLREILASQQELIATALRVERLLRDRREQEQPDVRRRSAGG